MYPADLVMPMKEELTGVGFTDVTTAAQAEELIKQGETVLMVINSVCGCAAGNARPGVRMSLDNDKKPDVLATVFAGFDGEAVAKVRELCAPYPPSSPSIAVFKQGELVHFIERHNIEGRPAEMIAENLKLAYNEFC